MATMAEQEILVEIDQLNTKLKKNPKNLNYVCRLASLHLDDNKLSRSKPHMMNAIQLFKEIKNPPLKQIMELADTMVKYWKADKYVGKQDVRINLSADRDQFLQQTADIAKLALTKKDAEFAHLLELRMAYVKECRGDLQGALALLSDLIAAQAMDNVDLSYIIFKAAVILMHVGQPKQAIEYVEFIMDDPPVHDGFTKTHLCAFLIHVYEKSGEKYKVFLPKTYKELQQHCTEDMPQMCSKLLRTQGKGAFGQGSELWETLALQALERCEYVLAAEFLAEAVNKAPGKAKLLHLLAEVHALLKEKEQAKHCAEAAYELNPQSSELRNLLLQVAPEVWTEKLRVLSSTTNARNTTENEGEEGENDAVIADAYAPPSVAQARAMATAGRGPGEGGRGSPVPSVSAGAGGGGSAAPPATSAYLSAESDSAEQEGASWLSKVKNKASGALKSIQASATSAARSPAHRREKKTAAAAAEIAPSPEKASTIAAQQPVPAGGAEAEGEQRITDKLSPKAREEGRLSPKADIAPTSPAKPEPEAQQATQPRPKSRSSFISMLLPDPDRPRSPARKAEPPPPQQQVEQPGAEDADRAQSPTRPKSRSSFISMLLPDPDRAKSPARSSIGSSLLSSILPTSFLSPGGSASAAAATEGNDSPGKPKGGASRASAGEGGSGKGSPSKGKSPLPVRTAPAPGKVATSSSPSKAGAAVAPIQPKPKKVTKYDVSAHASKLAVDEGEGKVRTGKPEKPIITRDERKMLDLILSGNENVPVYDPNLLVLHQMRASSRKLSQTGLG